MAAIYKKIEDVPSEHTRNVILASAKVFYDGNIQTAFNHFNAIREKNEKEGWSNALSAQAQNNQKDVVAEVILRAGKPS